MAEVVLAAEGVSTRFRTPGGVLTAVDGVSFEVRAGQAVGIVGESGSGKSVLARTVYGLYPPGPAVETAGRVRLLGTDLTALPPRERRAHWGTDMAIVLQDPMTSLNPVVRNGRQVTEHVRLHRGLGKDAARTLGTELLARLGVPDPARRMSEYPHQLSGGLRQRVAIAIALAAAPRLLIADEPTTALDVTIQAQILRLLDDARRREGVAQVLITHDLAVVAEHSDHVLVMYAGRVVERGPTRALLQTPRMPYTAALLESAPRLSAPPHTRLQAIPGSPPSPLRPAEGCAFAPRCAFARARCREQRPPLVETGGGRAHACWYPLPAASGHGRGGR